MTRKRRVDFARVANAAAGRAQEILARWLPNGRREGREWVSVNPVRNNDAKPGSFKVNIRTGAWAEFADDARGRDLISLASYLFKLDPRDACIKVAEMLGIDPYHD